MVNHLCFSSFPPSLPHSLMSLSSSPSVSLLLYFSFSPRAKKGEEGEWKKGRERERGKGGKKVQRINQLCRVYVAETRIEGVPPPIVDHTRICISIGPRVRFAGWVYGLALEARILSIPLFFIFPFLLFFYTCIWIPSFRYFCSRFAPLRLHYEMVITRFSIFIFPRRSCRRISGMSLHERAADASIVYQIFSSTDFLHVCRGFL